MANEICSLCNDTETVSLSLHMICILIANPKVWSRMKLVLVYIPVDDKRIKHFFFFAIILLRYNSHNIKFTVFRWKYSSFWYIHSVVQLTPASNSRTFLSPQKETPYLLVTPSSLCPQSLATTNQSTFCLWICLFRIFRKNKMYIFLNLFRHYQKHLY